MFPDSQITKSFALSKDKTGYIIKFGIAPNLKRQLIESINHAGPYVHMFDESINQSKKKQMDIHICFLEDSCVHILVYNSRDTEELMICCSTSFFPVLIGYKGDIAF